MRYFKISVIAPQECTMASVSGNLQKNQQSFYVFCGLLAICLIFIMCFYVNATETQFQHCRVIPIKNGRSVHLQKRCFPPYTAYIISGTARRFNFTMTSLHDRLPGFFDIHKKEPVPLNDSRIPSNVARGAGSLLFTYIDLWHYLGSKSQAELADNDWVFVFEDDVDIVPMHIIERFYSQIYKKWKHSEPIHSIPGLVQQGLKQAEKDGILYLGTCGPEYRDNDTTIRYSLDGLFQYRRGAYFCTHAVAYKKWRARTMWGDFASYMFVHSESGSDTIARQWQILSKNFPISAASNIHWPPNTGHFGLFYQARGLIPSTIHE